MKICRVNIPFKDKVTGKIHKVDDELLLSDERIAEIKAVNPGFVVEIGVVPEEPEPEPEAEPEAEPKKEPKKEKAKKE